MSVALLTVAGLSLLTSPLPGDVTLLGISPELWVLAAVYVGGVRVIDLDQRVSSKELAVESHVGTEPTRSLSRAILGFVAAAAVVLIVGPFMAHAADSFATATGPGKTLVGTTLVALSTSLPEFVASLAAVRMGAYDLAIGNIFGSNALNMLLLVPLDIVRPGSLMAVVSAGHGITWLASILATQTVIMGQLYNVEGRCRFIDPDA